MADIPVSFNLKSGVFTEQGLRSELATMRAAHGSIAIGQSRQEYEPSDGLAWQRRLSQSFIGRYRTSQGSSMRTKFPSIVAVSLTERQFERVANRPCDQLQFMIRNFRSLLFPRGGLAFSRMTLLLGIIISTSFISAKESFSSGECEYPEYFSTLLVPSDSRLGEVRIVLDPPDYDDAASLQQHLSYATILGTLIGSALKDRTRGICDAVITPARFPDLHAVLFLTDSPGATETNRSLCLRVLQDSLLKFQPDEASVRKIASSKAEGMLRAIANPGSLPIDVAHDILRSALRHIYDADTVMHALVSVDQKIFQSLDVVGFLGWLRNQRSAGALRSISIPTRDRGCGGNRRHGVIRGAHASKLPYSAFMPPGTVKILMRKRPALSAALRHVVIVGNDRGRANAPLLTPATDRFCNRERAFAIAEDSVTGLVATVWIRCLAEMFYATDSWVVFFCEPNDSISENAAEKIMTTIANDPAVLALARSSTGNKQPRGPYMVNVNLAER